MSTRYLLFLTISALLIFNGISSSTTMKVDDDQVEDLDFLVPSSTDDAADSHAVVDEKGVEYYDVVDEKGVVVLKDGNFETLGPYPPPAVVDEKDVVVLKGGNFSEFIEKNKYVMVDFYAPWCRFSQSLAPEYAAAATELKGEVSLAKVDVTTEESDLVPKYEVVGYPTVMFFIDGVHRRYYGDRTKESIVTWIMKIGPGVRNITTTEEAERILAGETTIVLGFLNSLVGPESNELSSASKLEDDINFYQTMSPDVAKLFQIDPNAKRPALILLKKEAEKLSNFNGQFTNSAIAEFVLANKLPLVNNYTGIFIMNLIKKQIWLFATSTDAPKVLPSFQDAAKLFKGKLIFVYVEMNNEDVGKFVLEFFGVAGDGPHVLAYTSNDNARKFILDGEATLDNVKAFCESFLEDKLLSLSSRVISFLKIMMGM